MRKPNFFIVGGPRCGTTALYTYLREHPGVFMPRQKECHFFADDFSTFRTIDSPHDYLRLFEHGNDRHVAVGEASVFYLASEVAISNIRRFDDSARLLVMIRNPVDVVSSLHGQLLTTFQEDAEDFEQAWRLQAERRAGRAIPALCQFPQCLQYARIAKFGQQLRRALRIFPREQVHVVMFEDFVKDTRQAYEDTLKFLRVPSDNRSSFPRINQNRTAAWRGLSTLISRPPPGLHRLKETVRRWIGEANYTRIARAYLMLMTSEYRPKLLLNGFREELVAEFRDDILLLSELLQKNLSHWLAGTDDSTHAERGVRRSGHSTAAERAGCCASARKRNARPSPIGGGLKR